MSEQFFYIPQKSKIVGTDFSEELPCLKTVKRKIDETFGYVSYLHYDKIRKKKRGRKEERRKVIKERAKSSRVG